MALDDSGDQIRVTSYRHIIFALIVIVSAIAAGLYFNREFSLVPSRIAESNEAMWKTDSMRHVFKVSMLASRGYEAFLSYLRTGDKNHLKKAANFSKASIGFASSALTDDQALAGDLIPFLRRNVEISEAVQSIEEASAMADEFHENMARIHRGSEHAEQDIWLSFQKDFVRFQTNEQRALIAYQFSAGLAIAVLLIVGFFFLRQRSLLSVIEAREHDLEHMVELRNEELQLLRKTQAAAEAADRAKTEFLALMSHELRTPLNAIIGFSEIVKSGDKRLVSGERTTEYASAIHSASLHLLNVINDILDLAKIEAGETELHETKIQLIAVIERSVSLIRQRSQEKHQTVSIEMDRSLPTLIGDERLVLQILINLLSNAVKFTGEHGEIAVFASAVSSGGLDIGVRDNGVGIASEHIDTVMQPFGQLRLNSAVTHEGTGLGLPLTGRFAELHGATVTLESELSKGTTVTIHFPPHRIAASNMSLS
ncbi:HAMP domain-containing sensor histidine kinase [Nisaea sp.]|uniref:sensor histidine kinase n=1 Tax=Nisaea sp. TaxID=2024842 RepID=UPI003263B8FD